tara:strand:- start:147 stop:722 length:576 start_codon:yes stop_codon:yes gene_type:complete
MNKLTIGLIVSGTIVVILIIYLTTKPTEPTEKYIDVYGTIYNILDSSDVIVVKDNGEELNTDTILEKLTELKDMKNRNETLNRDKLLCDFLKFLGVTNTDNLTIIKAIIYQLYLQVLNYFTGDLTGMYIDGNYVSRFKVTCIENDNGSEVLCTDDDIIRIEMLINNTYQILSKDTFLKKQKEAIKTMCPDI